MSRVAAPSAQGSNESLPIVRVIATGGTIAGRGTSAIEYEAGQATGEELVEAVPGLRDVAQVEVEQFVNIPSPDITAEMWVRLADRINTLFGTRPDLAGIVITHGTNTMEETAYFLNLTVKFDRPVVLVGAQRPSTAFGADGPLNLLNAVRVAASPASRGKGVLVVMNDEIHAARDVTKANTYRVNTFQSWDLGPLGFADGDEVVYYRLPTRRHTIDSEFDAGRLRPVPRVDIVYSYAESPREGIDALVNAGVRGFVLAGTGSGGASPAELQGLIDATRRGVVVVRASRVGSGRVVERSVFAKLGFIPGDNLLPQKARILLMLALSHSLDHDGIRRVFREY